MEVLKKRVDDLKNKLSRSEQNLAFERSMNSLLTDIVKGLEMNEEAECSRMHTQGISSPAHQDSSGATA